MGNWLYCGDCLDVMRASIADQSVDLIYLDPPFNTGRDFGHFDDRWQGIGRTLLTGKLAVVVDAARIVHGDSMGNYLAFMGERLLAAHRTLKQTGSLYLHCDQAAGHYLKLLLDSIFGYRNFRNEIAWCYSNSGRAKRFFARKHDTILLFTKSDRGFWGNYRVPISEKYLKCSYRQIDSQGRRCRVRVDAGKTRVYYPDDGMTCNDWWDIPSLGSRAKERLGYPTQKPIVLLERIIQASSNSGDLVLDPFCGSATTLEAAHRLGRNWIGIDISSHAVKQIAQVRLNARLGLAEGVDYSLVA